MTIVVDGQPRDLDEHLVLLAVSAETTGLVVPSRRQRRSVVPTRRATGRA